MGSRRSIPLLLLLIASCRQTGVPFVPDSGVAARTCTTSTECSGQETCVAGLCQQACTTTTDCRGQGICVAGACQEVKGCQNDDECASEGLVCHNSRNYCVECDGTHAGECPENSTCQFDFTCVMIGNGSDGGTNTCSGSCTDRNECAPSNVCKNNTCCPPPARCSSVADCPVAAPTCNGATGECFGGESCFDDDDCDGKAGCAPGACRCDIGSAPPGTCALRGDECQSDVDCRMNGAYAGKFCSINTPPKRCLNAPACASDRECQNDNLLCDLMQGSDSYGRCVNGAACTLGGSECDSATQVCVNNVCVVKNCLNTPTLCGAGETCDPNTGQCIPSSCTSDSNCQAGFYCNTVVNPSMCEVGCRDNTECGGGVCDASHRCQGGSGFCSACTDTNQCPANSRCVSFTGQCHEMCSLTASVACSDPNRTCIFGICSCIL